MDSREKENCAQQARADQQSPIRQLNDRLRSHHKGGYHCMTNGVVALGYDTVRAIQQAVAAFSDFNGDNDPYNEHDFGSLTVAGHQVFWKIDYYDENSEYGSPDPSDPSVTSRYLTIMLAHEY